MSWYYLKQNETVGPIHEHVVVDLIRQGHITGATMVWRAGMKDWQAAQVTVPKWFASSDEPPPLPTKNSKPPSRTHNQMSQRHADGMRSDLQSNRQKTSRDANAPLASMRSSAPQPQHPARDAKKANNADEPPPILDMPDFSSAVGVQLAPEVTLPDLSGRLGDDIFQGAAVLNFDSPSFQALGNQLDSGFAPVNLLGEQISSAGDFGVLPGAFMPEFVCCSCGNMAPMSRRVKFQGKDICPACKARFDALTAEGGNVFYDDALKQAGKQTAWNLFLYSLAALTMLCVLALLFSKGTALRNWGLPIRMTASTGFLLLAVACGAFKSRYGQLILAALVFCWLGDLLLGYSFKWGLLAFLTGHVILIAAFCVRGIAMEWALVAIGITIISGAAVMLWLYPHIPKDRQLYVFAYMVFISVMVIFAAGARGDDGSILILLGAIAFYFSDVFVARQCFVKSSPINSMIGLPLYYASVLALAFSIRAEGTQESRILK